MLYRDLSCKTEWVKGDRKVGMTLSKQIIIGYLEKLTSNKSDCLSRDSFLWKSLAFNVNIYRLVRANSNSYGAERLCACTSPCTCISFFFRMRQVLSTHGHGPCTICRIQLQWNKHKSYIYTWKCSSSVHILSHHHWNIWLICKKQKKKR